MGLYSTTPTRNRTYVKGTPGEPQDMNDLQDIAVALRTPRWLNFAFPRAPLETNVVFLTGGTYPGGIVANAGSAFYKGGSVGGIPQGSTIQGYSVIIKGTGGAQSVVSRLMLRDFSALTFTAKGTVTANTPSSTPTKFSVSNFVPFTLDDGDVLTVEADMPLNTTEIQAFQILVKPPW
jgi:hypothetical protein